MLSTLVATAAILIHAQSINTVETKTDVNETFIHQGQGSLEFQTAPQFFAAHWHLPTGPFSGIVSGYPDAVLHLTVDADAQTVTAFITSSADSSPGRWMWWPEPVEASYALDAGPWSWDLPSPLLESVAGSDGVKTNPDLLRVTILGAEAPEPSVHWLLVLSLACLCAGRGLQRVFGAENPGSVPSNVRSLPPHRTLAGRPITLARLR